MKGSFVPPSLFPLPNSNLIYTVPCSLLFLTLYNSTNKIKIIQEKHGVHSNYVLHIRYHVIVFSPPKPLQIPRFRSPESAPPTGDDGLAVYRRNLPTLLSEPKCFLCLQSEKVSANDYS